MSDFLKDTLIRAFAVLAFVYGCAILLFTACTPAQRQTIETDVKKVEPFVGPVEKIGCVIVRMITTDGDALEICATADELAPLVPQLLASREASDAGPPSGLIIAASLPAPRVRVHRPRDGGVDARLSEYDAAWFKARDAGGD